MVERAASFEPVVGVISDDGNVGRDAVDETCENATRDVGDVATDQQAPRVGVVGQQGVQSADGSYVGMNVGDDPHSVE